MATKKVKVEIPETPELGIKSISKDVMKITKDAEAIVIKSEADYKGANDFLVIVKENLNKINTMRSFFTDPYVEQRRVALAKKNEIDALFDKQTDPLTSIEAKVKRAMSDFKLEEDRKARLEEARLQKIRDEANAKREEKGQEQIMTPVKTVERVEQTVQSEDGLGKSTAKKVWKFEVTKISEFPEDILKKILTLAWEKGLIEQIIRNEVKAGAREIKGVRIYEDFEIAVTAPKK